MSRFQKLASDIKSMLGAKSLLIASTLFFAATGSQANAHWPRGHHWGGGGWGGSSWGYGSSFGYSGWGGGWGGYGMGGGFGHRSFYSPAYSVRSVGFGFPIHRSFHSGFGFGCSPVGFNPIVYRPVFCAPVYYQPIQYCPAPVVPIFYQTSFPVCSTTPRLNGPAINGQGQMLQVSNTQLSHTGRALQLASATPRVAYKPSTAWTNEAIALIDDMAQSGGATESYAAAKQLMKSHNALPGHFYTRAAILGALNNADSSVVLRYLELAKTNQADPNGSDLPGGSIRSFVAKIPSGSMDKLLNTIAAKALSKDNDRKPEFKVLASLLVMDGQTDRASRFANAIDSPASNTGDDQPNVPAPNFDIRSLALAK